MLGGSQLEDTLFIVHLVGHAFGVFSCKVLRLLEGVQGGFVTFFLLLADC